MLMRWQWPEQCPWCETPEAYWDDDGTWHPGTSYWTCLYDAGQWTSWCSVCTGELYHG